MSWSDGDEKIILKWNGAFRLSDDEKDIEWMEDGAQLTISDGVIFKSTIELRGVNGRIERTFSKNGMRRDYEPEGRQFLAAGIDKLIKRSGMFAKERVAKYLKRGGPDAVMAEIAKLGDSSYTHRIYYTELARQAELSESLLVADPAARPGGDVVGLRQGDAVHDDRQAAIDHRGASRADRARGRRPSPAITTSAAR